MKTCTTLIFNIPQQNLGKGTQVVVVTLPGQLRVCYATVEEVWVKAVACLFLPGVRDRAVMCRERF